MDYKTLSKLISLVLSMGIIIIGIFMKALAIDPSPYGLSLDSSLWHRLIYPFIHASLIHATVNAWVLLLIVFVTLPRPSLLLISYILSTLIPSCCLSHTPTVGLSVMIYILLGYTTLIVKRRLYFFLCCSIYILLGFLFSKVNPWSHVYGYVIGLSLAFLIAPLWQKK